IAINSYLNPSTFELFDFDNTTGIVSNSLSLGSFSFYPCGVEFSPDGSKLYGTSSNDYYLHQWDLCAGSDMAIVNSHTLLPSPYLGHMNLGPDGKIYIAVNGASSLGVINNPNL